MHHGLFEWNLIICGDVSRWRTYFGAFIRADSRRCCHCGCLRRWISNIMQSAILTEKNKLFRNLVYPSSSTWTHYHHHNFVTHSSTYNEQRFGNNGSSVIITWPHPFVFSNIYTYDTILMGNSKKFPKVWWLFVKMKMERWTSDGKEMRRKNKTQSERKVIDHLNAPKCQ